MPVRSQDPPAPCPENRPGPLNSSGRGFDESRDRWLRQAAEVARTWSRTPTAGPSEWPGPARWDPQQGVDGSAGANGNTHTLFFVVVLVVKKQSPHQEREEEGKLCLSSFIFQVPSLDLPRLHTGVGLSYAGPEGVRVREMWGKGREMGEPPRRPAGRKANPAPPRPSTRAAAE